MICAAGSCDLTITSITSLVDDESDDDDAYAGSCGLYILESGSSIGKETQNRLMSTDKDALR